MDKSAKGEIQTRQGGFLAYEVSGEAPLIPKGGEGASASVCEGIGASNVSSVEASNNHLVSLRLSAPPLIKHGASDSGALPKNRLSGFS